MSDADDEELPDLAPTAEIESEKFNNFPRKKRRNQYRGRPFILTEDADDEREKLCVAPCAHCQNIDRIMATSETKEAIDLMNIAYRSLYYRNSNHNSRSVHRSRFKRREKEKFRAEKRELREPIVKLRSRSLHQCGVSKIYKQCCDTTRLRRLAVFPLDNESNETRPTNTDDDICNIDWTPRVIKPLEDSNHDTVLEKIRNWKLSDSLPPNDLITLVSNCRNLSLNDDSSANENQESYQTPSNSGAALNQGTVTNGTSSSSCSQQARMNTNNCDVTMDELASYFETFVHIPKKMSSMAEMMYI